MLGDSVEITEGYRTWWSYIPHFIATPGYVYAYAYGQLLALSVYAQYEARGPDFVPQYLDLLRAGGSMAPEEPGPPRRRRPRRPRILGPRARHHRAPPRRDDRGRRGLGKVVMTYRVIQWSTGNVGTAALRCIIRHPELELVGVWVHSPDKAGKDTGALCGMAPTGVIATNDTDALLALDADCVSYTATADLRPMDAIVDMERILRSGKNVVSSSVVAAIYPRTSSRRCASRSTTRARRPGFRASPRASTPAGRTTRCHSCSRVRARTSSTCA